MCLENVLDIKPGVAENVYASLSAGQIKLVIRSVPSDFVDFKIVLFLGADLASLEVDERYQVLLVPDSDCVSIRRPRNVNVFSFRGDGCDRFAAASVPNANC